MSSKRDVEIADTLPPEQDEGAAEAEGPASDGGASHGDGTANAPPRPVDAPPVVGWDRYELLELLGKGGMGSVYKARDRRLGRTVAIKFMQSADPNLTMRFVREARAQARIDHPNVCRVYEADHVNGRAYIALQYIAGEALHRAAARMSLDEKIAAMREVATAVHEAHRLGIVHRDLKPANVLVERRDDGRWVPIVMDFGLAREATVELGITESGVPLGTPAYMSPEQARGDVRAIDRRSDVYGLGATLYELLVGQPPFSAASLVDALSKAIHDEPAPPRSLAPSLPADLETVALKCLAKDPAQRYTSARAFADDLGRYLDGEPILGRRVPWWQRVRRRARRHRALVILAACSLAIIATVASLGIRSGLRSAERARLGERLGREASHIESTLRESYLLPPHDTRPDRARVRERMKAIAGLHPDLGELGDALIHDALGRGHLALHEWAEADDELARAAAGGVQTPELHAARSRALGELYRRGLETTVEEARRGSNKAWRAQQEQELEHRYLEPALAELEASRDSEANATVLDAMIALYRRKFADAEQRALAAAERDPGASEAHKLAADAAYGAAFEAFDRGDYDDARAGLARATSQYAAASEIARSDASLYEAAAQSWLQRAEIDFRQGRVPREALDRALELIDDHALHADPDDAAALTTKAYVRLLWYRAQSLIPGAESPPELLQHVAEAASRAVGIDQGDAAAWTALGNAHVYRCIYETDCCGAGGPWCNRALTEFEQALAIKPGDARARNDLGTAHRWLGASLLRSGQSPMPEYQRALRSYADATAIVPQDMSACTNQLETHVSIAEYEATIGTDPRPALDRARQVGQACLSIDRSSFYVFEHLARGELVRAQAVLDDHMDPADELQRARKSLEGEEAVHPGFMPVRYFRLIADRIEAAFQLIQGTDPTDAIAAGRGAWAEAIGLSPGSALCEVEIARLDLVEARSPRAARRAGTLLASALDHAKTATQGDKRLAEAWLVAAEASLQIAAAQRSLAAAGEGISHVEQALALHPGFVQAKRVFEQLRQLRDELLHAPSP